jgi:hypothetical protein
MEVFGSVTTTPWGGRELSSDSMATFYLRLSNRRRRSFRL